MVRDSPVSRLTARWGPISEPRIHRTPPDYAFLHAVTVEIRDIDQLDNPLLSAGGGLTLERALSAATGEALERYCLRRPRCLHEHIWPDGATVAPASLLHYRDEVFSPPRIGLRRYAAGDTLGWILGRHIGDGKPVWVPAFAVFSAGRTERRNEDPFDDIVSTGGASASDSNIACLHGLYEVIERDAFTIHWENRWPGEHLPLPSRVQEIAGVLENRGFSLHVRRLCSDTDIPVALAVVCDKTGRRAALALGAAARRSWELAAFRAAEEAVLTSFWVTDMHRRQPEPFDRVYAEMALLPTPARHAFLYGFREMSERAAFLWNGHATPTKDVEPVKADLNPAAELHAVVTRVRAVGADPIVVSITDEEVARLGAHVVRVVVPGFVPLARGTRARPLANPRLIDVPQRFGIRTRANDGFNSDPHPFP